MGWFGQHADFTNGEILLLMVVLVVLAGLLLWDIGRK